MTREEAKRVMLFAKREVMADSYIDKAYDVAIEALGEPTIEKRKKGKWIDETKHHKDDQQDFYYLEVTCSECGVVRKIGWRDANYCPNCGADMRGERDDEQRSN